MNDDRDDVVELLHAIECARAAESRNSSVEIDCTSTATEPAQVQGPPLRRGSGDGDASGSCQPHAPAAIACPKPAATGPPPQPPHAVASAPTAVHPRVAHPPRQHAQPPPMGYQFQPQQALQYAVQQQQQAYVQAYMAVQQPNGQTGYQQVLIPYQQYVQLQQQQAQMQQQAQLQQQAQMQFSAFQFAQPLPQAAFQPAPVAYATQGVPMATQGYATPSNNLHQGPFYAAR